MIRLMVKTDKNIDKNADVEDVYEHEDDYGVRQLDFLSYSSSSSSSLFQIRSSIFLFG